MITPLTRKAVFKESPFADKFIAQMQESYAADLDVNIKSEARMLNKYYDHLKTFGNKEILIDSHCVIAFKATSKKEYFANLPLNTFLTALKFDKIYFLDFLNTRMIDFPFQNFTKRNKLKRMLNGKLACKTFLLERENVVDAMELFYFSTRFGRPAITVVADGKISLALRLCKDGNFHLNFNGINAVQIKQAAHDAGFISGDLELCGDYSIFALP